MLTRRTLMKGALVAGAYAGGIGLAGNLGGFARAKAATSLAARRTEAMLTEHGPTKGAMTYGDGEVPPVLRLRRGDPFALRLDNRLDEPTTIHWHGLRIPVQMDGVPHQFEPEYAGVKRRPPLIQAVLNKSGDHDEEYEQAIRTASPQRSERATKRYRGRIILHRVQSSAHRLTQGQPYDER